MLTRRLYYRCMDVLGEGPVFGRGSFFTKTNPPSPRLWEGAAGSNIVQQAEQNGDK